MVAGYQQGGVDGLVEAAEGALERNLASLLELCQVGAPGFGDGGALPAGRALAGRARGGRAFVRSRRSRVRVVVHRGGREG